MLSFESDYTQGAHPAILNRLVETNFDMTPGYGTDVYCDAAKEKIRSAIGDPKADVYFLVGGTQTNTIVIDGLLSGYEGVVAAVTGHITTHEAGAIEASGHKVLALPEHDGKIDPKELCAFLETFYGDANHEHMVFPGMVYISHPTEYGTLYSLQELTEISDICRRYEMPLFMDGARLGYGLMSYQTDVTLQDIARLCDAFYIGGTKVGALFGEAVVFTHHTCPRHFITTVKQHGGLLAKGRLLGLQFDVLFTDRLYETISLNAIEKAERLKQMFRDKGYTFHLESPTNQQFIVLDNDRMEELKKSVRFSFWEVVDETHTAVRFVTSWATTDQDMDELERIL